MAAPGDRWHAAPMFAQHAFVIVDTETGGLDPQTHSLLSVGLVSGDRRHSTEFFVVEPTLVTDPKSMAVNRLDLAQVKAEGLDPAAACDAIGAFIEATGLARPVTLVGHNIAFDLAFLHRLYRLAGRDFGRDFSHRSVDTHSLLWAAMAAGRLPPGVGGSDAAFAHFGIAPPPEKRHTALGDALATADLLERLLQTFA
ncbi:MAG: 3'-5' exonuclease [Myxococcales bacterium]|nr:3'-5' exonuclease [Myxococcales bacterium]